MKSTIRQILRRKGTDIWSVAPETTVFEALQLMADKDIGSVLVIKEGRLVGIFSERDYARKVILKGRTSKETSVGELMTKEVYYINPDDTIEECMALMTAKRIRHLPVMENDTLIGVVSIGDVVNQLIGDKEFIIQELGKYISGGY